MATLSDGEIDEALARLPGWARAGNSIAKEYSRGGFADVVALVVRIGFAAEAADHHPDLDIRYSKLRVVLSTHSDGGVTAKDVALATKIESLAAESPG